MNIVGLNFSLDSAAALVCGGRRVAATQEERFSRHKHDKSFPIQALKFCLKYGGVRPEEVDAWAFFWNPGRHLEPALTRMSGVFRHHAEYLYDVPNHLLQVLGQPGVEGVRQTFRLAGGRELTVHYVDHHLAHAAGAFYCSPFESAATLSMDGYGERTACLICNAEGRRVEPAASVEFPHSIGSWYSAFTQYLGFRANSGEGKVMGLASYGRPALYDKARKLVRFTEEGFELDRSYFSYDLERTTRYTRKLVELFGAPREPESELTERHEDVAAAMQYVAEEMMLHLARVARRRTGKKDLCLAGGVALNVVGNRRIQFESGFERIFIYPPAGDAGTSLGAALYVAHVLHGEPRDESEYLEYLGFEGTRAQVAQAVKTTGAAHAELSNVEEVTAKLLARGKIVGWFQGRAEFGPRALGNRSILADPRPAEMKDILNARVKFREPFRPFAPSCLVEACGELFESSVPSPFMLRVYDTRPERLKELGAVTHVDGGARVQTVSRTQNPKYYRLIEEFGKLTGVPCVLNTSFNIRGEPIVNDVKEALFCFFGTDMDYLVAGDILVAKTRESLEEAVGRR